MMSYAASVAIAADRYTPCVRTITFRGIDLSGVALRLQIRLLADTPGIPLVDLQTVGNAQAQGIKLVSVTTTDGYPISVVQIRINETTIEGMPYSGELGSSTALEYDMQGTLGGDKRVLMAGSFVIAAGVTGADAAPLNRPFGQAVSTAYGMRTGAVLTFGETKIEISIDGAELVAPIAAQAEISRLGAAAHLAAFPNYFKGDPGGNAMAIGKRMAASTFTIPVGTDLVQTDGFASTGIGQALYAATIDTGVAAHRFQSKNGRWFKLAVTTVTPQQFGAIADGTMHRLSERFATLADAQLFYPFVTSLNQSIDYAAVQAAHDAIESVGGTVSLERGIYIFTDSIQVGNFVTFAGQTRRGCVLGSTSIPFTKPNFIQKYSAIMTDTTLRDFTVKTGSHIVQFNASAVRYLIFERIDVDPDSLISVSEYEFNRLECAVFRDLLNVPNTRGGYFIDVQNYPFNSVEFIHARVTCAGLGVIKAVGVESVTWIGGSMEAAGVLGRAAITITGLLPDGSQIASKSISFIHVYFEGIHEFLLRARNVVGLRFQNCKTTGSRDPNGGPMIPVKWDVDQSIIIFDSNYFDGTTQGPLNMLLVGSNQNLVGNRSNVYAYLNGRSGRATSRQIVNVPGPGADANAPFSALTIARPSAGTTNDQSQQQMLTGTLEVRAVGYDAMTGAPTFAVYRFPMTAWFPSGAAAQVRFSDPVVSRNGNVTVGINVGATPTLANVVISTTNLNSGGNGYRAYSIEWDCDAIGDALSVFLT